MKILVTHEYPPIPLRSFDYSAIDIDNYCGCVDCKDPVGRGPSPASAIKDLFEQLEEKGDYNMTHKPYKLRPYAKRAMMVYHTKHDGETLLTIYNKEPEEKRWHEAVTLPVTKELDASLLSDNPEFERFRGRFFCVQINPPSGIDRVLDILQ